MSTVCLRRLVSLVLALNLVDVANRGDNRHVHGQVLLPHELLGATQVKARLDQVPEDTSKSWGFLPGELFVYFVYRVLFLNKTRLATFQLLIKNV